MLLFFIYFFQQRFLARIQSTLTAIYWQSIFELILLKCKYTNWSEKNTAVECEMWTSVDVDMCAPNAPMNFNLMVMNERNIVNTQPLNVLIWPE